MNSLLELKSLSTGGVPQTILDKVKLIELSANELFVNPPFKISEVLKFIEDLVGLISLTEGITKTQLKGEVKEIWAYFNEKYGLIDKIDEMLKLPAIVEPFDGMLINEGIKLLLVYGVGALPIPD